MDEDVSFGVDVLVISKNIEVIEGSLVIIPRVLVGFCVVDLRVVVRVVVLGIVLRLVVCFVIVSLVVGLFIVILHVVV